MGGEFSKSDPYRARILAPCENFRPRLVRSPDSAASAHEQAAIASPSRSSSIVAFIAAAALVGFATNLSMHLLNLRMQSLEFSEFAIGFSVAVQALGIVVAAPVTKHVISSLGLRQTLFIGALLSSIALVLFTPRRISSSGLAPRVSCKNRRLHLNVSSIMTAEREARGSPGAGQSQDRVARDVCVSSTKAACGLVTR